MYALNNAAQAAAQAELCLIEVGVVWEAFLMVECGASLSGMNSCIYEPLNRAFASPGAAMGAAEKLAKARTDVLGCSVKRVEVTHGL